VKEFSQGYAFLRTPGKKTSYETRHPERVLGVLARLQRANLCYFSTTETTESGQSLRFLCNILAHDTKARSP